MSLAAVIAALIVGGGSIGAVIAFALRLDDARKDERNAQVMLAQTERDLAITQSTLATTDRLRLAEKERARALEDELAALDRDVAVPGGATARDRVLQRWKAANDLAATTAAAGGGSGVPERPAAPAAGPGDRGKAAGPNG